MNDTRGTVDAMVLLNLSQQIATLCDACSVLSRPGKSHQFGSNENLEHHCKLRPSMNGKTGSNTEAWSTLNDKFPNLFETWDHRFKRQPCLGAFIIYGGVKG